MTREQYLGLGAKRCRLPIPEREKIYDIFEQYQHEKRKRNLFDTQDLVWHITRSLEDEGGYKGALIHDLVVDEAQDLSESQIMLLMHACHPNVWTPSLLYSVLLNSFH